MHSSYVETGLAGNGTFRWVAADLTLVLEEARRRLDLSPLASVALGRSLTGAALLQRLAFKVPARLILEVSGDGTLGSVRAEAESTGGMRGTVANPRVEGGTGDFRIAGALGEGSLRVTRESAGRRYTSQVSLISGELGDDLTHYLEQSEQVRSAILLGVLPVRTGIAAAGGLIVEALPGTDEDSLRQLETNINSLEGVSRQLEAGGVPRLLAGAFAGLDPEQLERFSLEYRCRCDRERLLSYLRALGTEDLSEVAEADGSCEAVCSYCGNRYLYRPRELSSSADAALGNAASVV